MLVFLPNKSSSIEAIPCRMCLLTYYLKVITKQILQTILVHPWQRVIRT